MSRPESESLFACAMCFVVCMSNNDLLKHIVKWHKHDPRFCVECRYDGCGATFVKWRSFQQHVNNIHREAALVINEIDERTLDQPDDVACREEAETVLDNNAEYVEPTISPIEQVIWYAAQFLVNVRENCKISQTAVDNITDGVINLMNLYSTIIIEEVERRCDPDTKLLHLDDLRNIYADKYQPDIIFSSVRSKYALDKILVEKFNMVSAEKISLGTDLRWKKKKNVTGPTADLCEVTHHAYTVPFLDNLRNLLENDEIRFQVENPREYDDNIMRTVLDGSHYRENDFFRNNRNALAIILYYDDLGIANPLGASSKTHKLSMFYWVLANIYPEVRSSQNAIQLLAIVKSVYMKQPDALSKILQPFITDITTLQTEGINVNVKGRLKNFKGSLLFCAADTPAAALLGGFKESVSAYRPCRTCLTTKNAWKTQFRESNFFLRNVVDHQAHIEAISEPSITKAAQDFWRKQYGVNRRSPLMTVPHFDVTMCLPQDSMHVLIEGIVEITCRKTLQYCIVERSIFTIQELNNRLVFFNYGPFSKDKPASIEREHLTTSNLRQSAAQMFVLAHTLPFLIGEWVTTCEDQDVADRIECFILLLQIMNICLAYEIQLQSIDLLSRMIETFILRFDVLYPDTIVPKFHFLVHVPRYIRLFGPGRQQWCFRFEAAHAYFKSLVPVVRNFKNMPLTLAYRHQSRLCSRLASYPGAPSKQFLYKGDHVDIGPTVLLNNLPYACEFDNFVPENERATCQIMRTSKIIVYGTTYEPNTIVLSECDENSLPVFAQIIDMFILGNRKLLRLNMCVTLGFENNMNAYHITMPVNAVRIIESIADLIFPHPLFCYTVPKGKYVSLINHERTEFIG